MLTKSALRLALSSCSGSQSCLGKSQVGYGPHTRPVAGSVRKKFLLRSIQVDSGLSVIALGHH